MTNETKTKVFIWLYRTFSYFVPGGIALYMFLIENLINKEVGVMQKVGCAGIFILVIIGAIALFFYGRHFKKDIEKYTNLILECTDDEKKKELIAKKRKVESNQDLFRNACFLAPFILIWLLCSIIEHGVISLRGTMLIIVISMATGMGFNGVAQYFKNKK